MKKLFAVCLILSLMLALPGCSGKNADAPQPADNAQTEQVSVPAPVPDGVYSALFNTDSSMFHVNEAYNGRGILTVKDGRMTIHVSLPSKNTVNLFLGTAQEAQADGAQLLVPTVDVVTYTDGMTEEVHGFDIPVPYLDEEFDCALIGTKGKWYDHKVSVSDPVMLLADGGYTMEVTLTGGSGRASIASPANITVEGGSFFAEIVWSSSHYEYMLVDGVQYDPVQTEGNSTFIIPITPDRDIAVSALTTAMSEPHLIDYVLRFDGGSVKAK